MNFNKKIIIKSVFINKGSNPIGDPVIIRKRKFFENVMQNYLTDNTIYYINYLSLDLLNLKKTRPWYRYRIFSENYINSEIGKFVELNGRFRTMYKIFLSGILLFPGCYVYNLLNKITRKFNLYNLFFLIKIGSGWNYISRYYKKWKDELIRIGYPELIIKNIEKIIDSSVARKNNSMLKPLNLEFKDEKIYYGKDARLFYKDYLNGTISDFVMKILNADYDHIIVENDKSYEAAASTLKFFSLFYTLHLENKK
jgi:hypothetical protein